MSIVRVRMDVQSVVYDAETEQHVPLRPGDPYDSKDRLVRQFPWAFESDVESATAKPGERRNVQRPTAVRVDG